MGNISRDTLLCLSIVSFTMLWGCGKSHTLPVTLRPQETQAWCWSASGEMIMEFLGTRVAQCDQANKALGRKDCSCNQCSGAPEGNSCATGGWPEFFRYGFEYRRTSHKPLSWAELKREIQSNRPVAFSWNFGGDGGHMMVAIGYFVRDGRRYVEVLDPASLFVECEGDAYSIAYEDYVDGEGYSHWDDFFEIRRR